MIVEAAIKATEKYKSVPHRAVLPDQQTITISSNIADALSSIEMPGHHVAAKNEAENLIRFSKLNLEEAKKQLDAVGQGSPNTLIGLWALRNGLPEATNTFQAHEGDLTFFELKVPEEEIQENGPSHLFIFESVNANGLRKRYAFGVENGKWGQYDDKFFEEFYGLLKSDSQAGLNRALINFGKGEVELGGGYYKIDSYNITFPRTNSTFEEAKQPSVGSFIDYVEAVRAHNPSRRSADLNPIVIEPIVIEDKLVESDHIDDERITYIFELARHLNQNIPVETTVDNEAQITQEYVIRNAAVLIDRFFSTQESVNDPAIRTIASKKDGRSFVITQFADKNRRGIHIYVEGKKLAIFSENTSNNLKRQIVSVGYAESGSDIKVQWDGNLNITNLGNVARSDTIDLKNISMINTGNIPNESVIELFSLLSYELIGNGSKHKWDSVYPASGPFGSYTSLKMTLVE